MRQDVSGFVLGRTDFHFRSVSEVNILKRPLLVPGSYRRSVLPVTAVRW